MDILISTYISEYSNLSQDLSLIKTAILYGDKVNLYSKAYSLFKHFVVLQEKNPNFDDLLQAAFVLADYCNEEDRYPLINLYALINDNIHNDIERLKNEKKTTKKEMEKLRQKLNASITRYPIRGRDEIKIRVKLDDSINDLLFMKSKSSKADFPDGVSEATISINPRVHKALKEIRKAIKSGIVNDLYGNYCPYLGIENIRTITYDILSKNKMVGILDEKIVGLKKEKDKKLKHDLKIANIASQIFSGLPNFESATIDEIIDIKKEISEYIIGFQKKLVTLANQVNSSVWDENFVQDVEDQLAIDVWPEVKNIENAVNENKSLLKYANKTMESLFSIPTIGSTSFLGAALVYMGVMPDSVQSLCTCGAAALLKTAVKIASEEKKEDNKIKQNDLFLVYHTKKILE
jgi:hypothetical protein